MITNYVCANPFTDLRVTNIAYRVNEASIYAEPPLALSSQRLVNNSSTATASLKFIVNETVTETSFFQNSSATGLEVGTSISVSTPFVDAGGSISISQTQERVYGEEQSIAINKGAEFSIEVPPCSSVLATATASKSRLDVPYTMTLQSPRTSQTFIRPGIWKGTSVWNLDYFINDIARLPRSSCS